MGITTEPTPSATHAPPAPPVLRWPALDATGIVDAAVTTRHGGHSAGPWASLNLGLHVGDDPEMVVRNRAVAAAAVGATLDDLVFCRQTHGTTVAVVTAADRGRGTHSDTDALDDTDAAVTADPGVALVVMVADCVPVVLVDPAARVLGCAHAGWRGTTADIVGAAVAAMVRLGADPGRIVAGIGPAIGAADYQVGPDVAQAAMTALGDAAPSVLTPDAPTPDAPTPDGGDRWRFDLPGANALLLRRAGVVANNIHAMATDTANPDLFSHRRDQPCGRFAAMARLIP